MSLLFLGRKLDLFRTPKFWYTIYVLSESLMHLPLRLIFCRRCLNFINVRAAYASKIQASPTKNPLANSGTTRFREHIIYQK